MKKKIVILIASVLALSSCGTVSYTSSSGQRFQDGIYTRPQAEDTQEILAAKAETDALVQKTRSSEIYISTDVTDGHRTDTLYIPEDKSATINFSSTGTSVTITDDPFEQVYFSTYPWTYYRPLTYASIYWDPWYYGRYWGYYDPWFWGPYYSSWYWGFAWDPWYYDPWFWGPAYPWHHYYCGWYGGWGPGIGWHGHVHGGYGRDIYYGHRGSTGIRSTVSSHRPRGTSYRSTSSRLNAGTRSALPSRTGISSSSSIRRPSSSRVTASGAGTSFSSSTRRAPSGTRTGIVATTRPSSRPGTGISTGQSSGSSYTPALSGARRSAHSYRGTSSVTGYTGAKSSSLTSGQANFRRPANSLGSGRTANSGYTVPSYNRGTSFQGSAGTSYNRSTSTSGFNRSSSSYNRQSSSSFNRSTSSYNRSTSSYSRSSSISRGSSSSGGGRSSGYSGGGGGGSVRRR